MSLPTQSILTLTSAVPERKIGMHGAPHWKRYRGRLWLHEQLLKMNFALYSETPANQAVQGTLRGFIAQNQ